MFLRRPRYSPTISSTLSLLILIVHDIRNSLRQHHAIDFSCASVLFRSVHDSHPCSETDATEHGMNRFRVLIDRFVSRFFLSANAFLALVILFLTSWSHLQSVANVLSRYSKCITLLHIVVFLCSYWRLRLWFSLYSLSIHAFHFQSLLPAKCYTPLFRNEDSSSAYLALVILCLLTEHYILRVTISE